MPTPTRPLALALAGLAAALTLSACGSGTDAAGGSMDSMSGHASSATTSAPATAAGTSGEVDVMFAQMMIPHHQQAVEMADLALDTDSGSSSRVTALATRIKAAQGPEIQTMTGWLQEWGAPASAPMDHGVGGMMSAEDMKALEAAKGAEFDRLWLTMMIDHHEGAITMARDVLSATTNAQVKALAEAVVEGQEQEITTMQGLLR